MPEDIEKMWKIYLRVNEEDGKLGVYSFIDPLGKWKLNGNIDLEELPLKIKQELNKFSIDEYVLINEKVPDRILSVMKLYFRSKITEGRKLRDSEMEELKKELESYMKK